MIKQITLKEALELVAFKIDHFGKWVVCDVYGNVCGDVHGNVYGDVNGKVNGSIRKDVNGNIYGNIYGSVEGNVRGYVSGNINGRDWEYIETPKDKLKRLIEEGADRKELLEAFNQLEDN